MRSEEDLFDGELQFMFVSDKLDIISHIRREMVLVLKEKNYITAKEFFIICGYDQVQFSDSKYELIGWDNLDELQVKKHEEDKWCIITPKSKYIGKYLY